jgi:hypothetical protein
MSSGIVVAVLEAMTLSFPNPAPPRFAPPPPADVLELALDETAWGMTVQEVRASFDGCALSRDRWWLEREFFRNHISCYVAGVEVSFRFAGIVASEGEPPLPTESALIEVEIGRTLKDEITRRKFPAPYLESMSQGYATRLGARGIAFGRAHRDSGSERWERFRTAEEIAQFTCGEGVRVRPTEKVLSGFLDRERRAANLRTRNWPRQPLEVCGEYWRERRLASRLP